MRKLLSIIGLSILLVGCSNGSASASPDPKKVPDIQADVEADMDFTFMSNTVLLSEVNQMIVNPDDYQDKVIRLAGTFSVKQDSKNNRRIYICEITDGTGCCPAGTAIQLFLKDETAAAPRIGSNIIVQGTMNYDISSYAMNMELRDAQLWEY